MPVYSFTDNLVPQNGPAPAIPGTIDSYMEQLFPDRNQGTSQNIELRENGGGDNFRLRGLVQFTGFSIPAGEVVTNALLWLHIGSGNAGEITVTRLLRSWTESGVTHNNYDGTNPWSVPGAQGVGTDKAGTAEDIKLSIPNQYVSFDVTNYAAAVASGASIDYGLLLERTGAALPETFFVASSESSFTTLRPELIVTTIEAPEGGGRLVDGSLINGVLIAGALVA